MAGKKTGIRGKELALGVASGSGSWQLTLCLQAAAPVCLTTTHTGLLESMEAATACEILECALFHVILSAALRGPCYHYHFTKEGSVTWGDEGISPAGEGPQSLAGTQDAGYPLCCI